MWGKAVALSRYHHCSVRRLSRLAIWQVEKLRQRTADFQLNLSPTLRRNDLDPRDQRADDARRLVAFALIGLQCVLELGYLPTVNRHRCRMKLHNAFCGRHCLKLSAWILLFALEVQQLRFHAGRRDTVSDSIDDVSNPPVDAGMPPFDFPSPFAVHGVQSLMLSMIFSKETRNGIWRQLQGTGVAVQLAGAIALLN